MQREASARLPAELMTLASAWASIQRTSKVAVSVSGGHLVFFHFVPGGRCQCVSIRRDGGCFGSLPQKVAFENMLSARRRHSNAEKTRDSKIFTLCLGVRFRWNIGRKHKKQSEHTQADMKLRLRLISCQQFGRLRKASSQTMCWET